MVRMRGLRRIGFFRENFCLRKDIKMGDFNNTIKKIVENYENLEKSIVSPSRDSTLKE